MVASRTAKVWRSSGTKEDVPDQVLAPEGLAADCLPTAQSEVQKISRLHPSTYARKRRLFGLSALRYSDFLGDYLPDSVHP